MKPLKTEFPNGVFGDPSLLVSDRTGRASILLDCGDLSRFMPRQLLRVGHIFLSHCHMDHFIAFDDFLRVHMGKQKVFFVSGPPGTTERVRGKFLSYTWNLAHDQDLVVIAQEFDVHRRTRVSLIFDSKKNFRPSTSQTEHWEPNTPVYDSGAFIIRACEIDHRTPSFAYAVEAQQTTHLRRERLPQLGLKEGAWIGKLKYFYSLRNLRAPIEVATETGILEFTVEDLATKLLELQPAYKIVYVTDGAASAANREKIVRFAKDADILFHESCFLPEDKSQAEATMHFTADFVGQVAQEAGVKTLVPFHYSKRYIYKRELVIEEIARYFSGTIVCATNTLNKEIGKPRTHTITIH